MMREDLDDYILGKLEPYQQEWGVYRFARREVHVARTDEQHDFSQSQRQCPCSPNVKIGDGYILAVHGSFGEMRA